MAFKYYRIGKILVTNASKLVAPYSTVTVGNLSNYCPIQWKLSRTSKLQCIIYHLYQNEAARSAFFQSEKSSVIKGKIEACCFILWHRFIHTWVVIMWNCEAFMMWGKKYIWLACLCSNADVAQIIQGESKKSAIVTTVPFCKICHKFLKINKLIWIL